MAERIDRLDLIQRAAKRLASGGESVLEELPPTREADSSPGVLTGMHVSNRPSFPAYQPEPAAPGVGAPPPSAPIQRAAPVRLNYPEFRRRGLVTPENTGSSVTFEFRAIKRKLLASARGANSNTFPKNMIMVTSALPGEGKTFTATNLALSLAAERDLRVLLIDGDVIKPTIGTLFDPPADTGLTDLLNGNCDDLGSIMHRCSDVPNLSVVFSGKYDARAPELISSRRTADLFLEISQRYQDRLVIFDTPPVLGSAEPANLAMYMNQIVVVVAAGAANRSQLQTALENISACPNISLVFNKAPQWHKTGPDAYYYYGRDSVSGKLDGPDIAMRP